MDVTPAFVTITANGCVQNEHVRNVASMNVTPLRSPPVLTGVSPIAVAKEGVMVHARGESSGVTTLSVRTLPRFVLQVVPVSISISPLDAHNHAVCPAKASAVRKSCVVTDHSFAPVPMERGRRWPV